MNALPMERIAASSAARVSVTAPGSACARRPQERVLAGKGKGRDESLGDRLVGVARAVDAGGHRGKEALGLSQDEGPHEVVAAGEAAVDGHPAEPCAAHDVLDGDPLEPDGRRLTQRRVEDALAVAVVVRGGVLLRCGLAEELDQRRRHQAATRARASATCGGTPKAQRRLRALSHW